MKKVLLFALFVSLLPVLGFSQDILFFPGGPKVEGLVGPVAGATEQINISEPVWLLGVSYALKNATSEIKIKDADVPTSAADAVRIGGLVPKWTLSNENTSGFVEFKYPLYCTSGIVLEATDANVDVIYIQESKRRSRLR